jgi:uncharacterized protein YbjT (DUF2867 family)
VIHVPGTPLAPVPRLLRALEDGSSTDTLVLGTGSAASEPELDTLLSEWRSRPRARVLVLGTLGTHRDARVARWRELWALEEQARATGLPVLALRLAPLIGRESPLWLRLRTGEPLPQRGRPLVQPVAEADVRATLAAAWTAEADWAGWYDVAGPEPVTLAELAALARREGALPRGAGAWEPSTEELAQQRLCDPRPWSERFRIVPRRLSEEARAWA